MSEILDFDNYMAPEYDRLMIGVTDRYLGAEPDDLPVLERKTWKENNPPPSTLEMSDLEFTSAALDAHQRPLNPMKLAKDALVNSGVGNAEDMSDHEVHNAIRKSYVDLCSHYSEAGYDTSILPVAYEMVLMTEAYVAGYSRQIGTVGERLESIPNKINRPYFGLRRWNSGLWVPDEDSHDRWQTMVMTDAGIIDQQKFYTDHSNHLTIGNPVDTGTFVRANCYVTLQEDATVITYENMAALFGPVIGYMFLKTMRNEAQHKRAYREVHLGFTALHPDETVLATEQTIEQFAMPGSSGITDFNKKSGKLAIAGILDPRQLYESQQKLITSMTPIILQTGLTSYAAKKTWEELMTQQNKATSDSLVTINKLDKIRPKLANKKTNGLTNIILGHTVAPNITKNGVGYPLLIAT